MFEGLEQCNDCENCIGRKQVQKLPFDESKGVEYRYLPECRVTQLAMTFVYPNCHYRKEK